MQTVDFALATVLKRDRAVVATALILLTLLAWVYVSWLAVHMATASVPTSEMPAASASPGSMTGMDMDSGASSSGGMAGALAPAFRAWSPTDLAFVFGMWSVMMVGMMTPSVAPMVLLYASVGRKAVESGTPFASTAWFFAGYLSVWIGFSALATLAQWALTAIALLTPMMVSTSAIFGGILLIAVGLYQWTPLKQTCLRACQAPLGFLMAHGGFRRTPLSAMRLGMAHGAYCLGCCFALMALLFVGGIMNLLWIAGLTILIFLEKIVPAGQLIPRIFGTLIGAAGILLLLHHG